MQLMMMSVQHVKRKVSSIYPKRSVFSVKKLKDMTMKHMHALIGVLVCILYGMELVVYDAKAQANTRIINVNVLHCITTTGHCSHVQGFARTSFIGMGVYV